MTKPDVPLIGQHTDMWCWAASAQMIMATHGVNISQCEQANYWLNRNDACQQPTPADCVRGGWPDFPHWGFNALAGPDGVALSFDEVRAQVDAKRPFAFSWHWTGGTQGHMMVVTGYSLAGGNELVHVNDPWPPRTGDSATYTYANFVGGDSAQGGSNPHTHWRDYYDIAPAGVGGAPNMATAGGVGPWIPVASDPSPGDAADRGKALVGELVTVEKASGLMLPAAAPGGPPGGIPEGFEPELRVYYLLQDQLLGYEPGADVHDMLFDGKEFMFPLTAGGEVTSSVVISKVADGWAIKRVGSPNLTRAITDARSVAASSSRRLPSDYFVVHVPHMYRVFLAHDEGDLVVFDPVFPSPVRRSGGELHLAAPGGSRTARAVLGGLAGQARNYVGALTDEPPE